MDVLRQLLDDAQSLLKDMSRTQRVSIAALLVSLAALLAIVIYTGSATVDRGAVPLPMQVEVDDVNELTQTLEAAGLGPVEYREGRLWVPAAREQDAILYLAEQDLLPLNSEPEFDAMLARWNFATTRAQSQAMMDLARQNFVAHMIARLDAIKEARVVYSDRDNTNLFAPSTRQRAAVEVQTRLGKQLDQKTADTIIALVAASKSGVEEADVVVTDQNGVHFRSESDDSLASVALKQMNLEKARRDQIRDSVERLCLAAVPHSRSWAFVDVRMNMDRINIHRRDYEEGPRGRALSTKLSEQRERLPPAEVGTRPDIGRAATIGAGGYRETYTLSRKESDDIFENDLTVTDTAVAPRVDQVTISAVIQLPFRYERDAEGNLVYELDQAGQPVLDDMGRPIPRRVPDPDRRLPQEAIDKLEENILLAAGIPPNLDTQVDIIQVDYPARLEFGASAPQAWTVLMQKALENAATIGMFLFLIIALVLLYAQAKRALPGEELEIGDEEALNLNMMPTISEADQANANFEAMRGKIADFVAEDAKKAAGLVRKWMTRENF